MQTSTVPSAAADRHALESALRAGIRRVVVVNGNARTLELLEMVLEQGEYDVVFLASHAHAYSHVKRLQPDLVVLCLQLDDPEGFRVLSMLKLDEGTRSIPVVTSTLDLPVV
jgi:CheY-like chemotaxis protein